MWKYTSFRSSNINQSPRHICERICFKVKGRRLSWGWGSSGCKSLTRSGLEERFLWLLFPADSSLHHALYLTSPPEVGAPGWLTLVWLSAESAQIWGDWKQKKSWSIWGGSVTSLEMTSEPQWNVQWSPPQLVQTGCLMRSERRGREFYPLLSSPSSWARGGTPIRWGWT